MGEKIEFPDRRSDLFLRMFSVAIDGMMRRLDELHAEAAAIDQKELEQELNQLRGKSDEQLRGMVIDGDENQWGNISLLPRHIALVTALRRRGILK